MRESYEKKNFFWNINLNLYPRHAGLSCLPDGTSKVTIHINLGLNNSQHAYNNSIFDRFLRLFAKDAEAQAAPTAYAPTIISLILNVTGPGMDTITQSYSSLPSSITVEVPAGKSRSFEVLASTASVTFRGTAKLNLSGEESVDLPINMKLYETKIIIPDCYNSRIIQIDDMSGVNWTYITETQPTDVDFDLQGRIYITTDNYVLRLNFITDTPEYLVTQDAANFRAIAVDRNNNLIYFSEGSTSSILHRCNLDGTDDLTLSLPGITFDIIRGLAVDNGGNLYIAAHINPGASAPIVIKYEPSTATVTTYQTDLTTPWDVLVKGNYLYVADYGEYGTNKIVQLNLNLNYINELVYMPGTENEFLGPHRFLAILNSKFYLIDENENDAISSNERIVAFDDFNSAWDSFIPSVAQGYFQFYSYC